MGSRHDRQRYGWTAAAGAVAVAGAGGSAVGLGAPAWLAGSIAALSALVATTVVDRVFHARDDSAVARQRRSEVLEALTTAAPGDRNDVLGLLRADLNPVPYRGRARELRRLAEWCNDDSANPVILITGPAGVGKSRLALEFASRLPEGWAAGWLHSGAGETAVNAIRECRDPAVILVDDADSRTDLVKLLDALAEQYESPAIRVILLTRSPAGLTRSLALQLGDRHEWVVTRALNLDLQPVGGPEDRERWFAEAVTAFAAKLNVAIPALPVRSYASKSDMNQPILVLQAHALLAVLGTPAEEEDPRKLSFEQVADALMQHEKRRWHATAATSNWGNGGCPSEALQERSIAALVLLGSGTDEAEQILRRIPELRDAAAERLSAIAAWISELYPPAAADAPRIRPDMIGEWFVVGQLTAHPSLVQNLRDGLTDLQAARALGFLARAADRIEAASNLFDQFASGDLRRQVLAAARAAIAGEVGRHLLDAVVANLIRSADGWTIDQLTEVDRMVSENILLLTRIAIADLRIRFWRAPTTDNPAAHQADLADALNDLGVRLGAVGRYQDALTATEEAVTLRRALVGDNPAAHQAGLARELRNLGAWLGAVGRYQEALTATEEAVTLRRALVGDNPAAHQADLAAALYTLGNCLHNIGGYQDMVVAAEEAVTLYRTLASDNPAAHQAHLADAMASLGDALRHVGRYQDAVVTGQETVTIQRRLAADNPAAHQANLAVALNNFGAQLEEVGRYQDALAATEETVTINRRLAADNPAAHQAGLAATLNNLGARLYKLGRYQEALAATEETVTLYRTLAADNPATHQAGLATALNNLSGMLGAIGRDLDALAAIKEAVMLRRALAADNPAAYQADLADTLYNLGSRLDRVDEKEDALAARTESVDVYYELASRNSDLYNEKYQQRLSALQQEYDQCGMQNAAILHHLASPPNHPASRPSSSL